MLDRRTLLARLGVSAISRPVGAQGFPSRTITIVVPYPPGGPIDSLARQGLPVEVKTPAEMSAMLPGEITKWAAVVKTANATVD